MRFSVVYWLITIVALFVNDRVIAAVVGVDYGQQFLKAMVVSPQAPMELILTPESKRKDISGLAIRKFGSNLNDIERFFGSAVGSISTRFPKDTLLHLKPLLGKTEGDITDITLYLREHPGVEIVETERKSLAFRVHDVEYSVEELTAMNIQELVNRANALLKEKDPSGFDFVDKLSLTVPEFFNQHQRKALLDVGASTVDNLQTCLVNDGLSVLINFAFKQRDFTPGEENYYLVYDMGSGSTKASLFSILQPLNESEPLKLEFGGYGFNDRLGGSKFTLEIASLIENKFLEEHKKVRTDSFHANPKALAKIVQAAEKAKLVLSANSEASVSIESLYNEIDFKTTISRSEFEDFIEDSLSEVAKPIENALSSQLWGKDVHLSELSGIILTGGSSRVPVVQQQLSNIIADEKILRSVNADESAVNGATIRGVKIFNAFKTKPLDIIERSFVNYGIKVNDEESEEIVFPKGAVYPTKNTVALGTSNDINDVFTIDFYENDRIFKTVTTSSKNLDKASRSESCPFGVTYNATFSLSQNRIFDVDKVEAICLKAPSNQYDSPENEDSNVYENNEETNSPKGKSNRHFKLSIKSNDVTMKHMPSDEKYRVRKHISLLVDKDKERFELEAAKNLLEGLLYETREYLEMEHVIEQGPRMHLEQLAEMIPDYLEWLEEDADGSRKVDIDEKIVEIQKLRSKIDTYLKYLSEPLDGEQFEKMIESGNGLLFNLTNSEKSVNQTLKLIEGKFHEFDLDVQKEYYKINLPSYISKLLVRWNETLTNMKETMSSMESLVDSGLLDETDREILLEMKLAFEDVSIELAKKIHAFDMGREYRMRELLSMAQRLEKARKRKEEKLKKSMAEQDMSATVISTSETTSKPESSVESSVESHSSGTESSTLSGSSIVHDEL